MWTYATSQTLSKRDRKTENTPIEIQTLLVSWDLLSSGISGSITYLERRKAAQIKTETSTLLLWPQKHMDTAQLDHVTFIIALCDPYPTPEEVVG